MNPIKQNAVELLRIMFDSGKDNFENIWFQEQTRWSPENINDAIYYLQNNNAVKVLKAVKVLEKFGIDPFNFATVHLTSNGRFLYHEWKEQAKSELSPMGIGEKPMDKKKVFVVDGRNEAANDALFQFLRAIGLNPIEWSQAISLTGKPAPYIGEVLDAAFSNAQAIVVLLTGDDVAKLRDEFVRPNDPSFEKQLTVQARPNVIFEAGMALGRHDDRTVIIELGELRPFTDISGRHLIKLNDSTARRQELAQRLKTAGCDIDLTGTQWHKVGEFENAILSHPTINEKKATQEKQNLIEEQINILRLLAEHEERGIDQLEAAVIAAQLSIPLIRTKHYLELLQNGEYIYASIFYNGQQSLYGLDSEGRAFLINHKLV